MPRENESMKMNKFQSNRREFILHGNILIFTIKKKAKNFSKLFRKFLKNF